MMQVAESEKVALVTGSSGGIGLLTAVALAEAGFHVIASMRSADKQQALLERAAAQGVEDRITVMELDVTDATAIGAAVDNVLERHGRIDCLVNNAGFAVGGFVEDLPLGEWRIQFDTNVFGLVGVTRAVLSHMRERGSGHIINISSISGVAGFPGLSAYSASKFAVEGFSEALRFEALPFGVHVSVVEPGPFKTGIWTKGLNAARDNPDSAYADKIRRFKAKISADAEKAPDPIAVARLIARIAGHPKPAFRYAVGNGIGLTVLAKRWLPWPLWEWLVKTRLKHYF